MYAIRSYYVWFYTRILGSTMNPIFLPPPATQQVGPSQEFVLRLSFNVLKNLGMMPMEAQRKPVSPTDPMINDLWLLYFGQSTVRSGNDYTFSVVTMIDADGRAAGSRFQRADMRGADSGPLQGAYRVGGKRISYNFV